MLAARKKHAMDAGKLPLERSLVEYTDGTTVFEGYVARPAGLAQRTPCVLLAHEWSGLNAAMRRCADQLAALGYIGFAADVYGKGVRGDELGDNAHLMGPMMADRRLFRRRLLAGFDAATRFPGVDAHRMAALGYCFGALCAPDLARAAPPNLLATVSFHGVLHAPRIGPQAPITSSIHATAWLGRPGRAAERRSRHCRGTHRRRRGLAATCLWPCPARIHVRGANLPERGIAYDAAADRRSWAAMQAFLAERLAPGVSPKAA
jgi:dienelactone hydrolase